MPIGIHVYRCINCGQQGTCGDCIRIYCPTCEKLETVCKGCGKQTPLNQLTSGYLCRQCWKRETACQTSER